MPRLVFVAHIFSMAEIALAALPVQHICGDSLTVDDECQKGTGPKRFGYNELESATSKFSHLETRIRLDKKVVSAERIVIQKICSLNPDVVAYTGNTPNPDVVVFGS
ncbi:hypothetical protein Fmac_009410 [Flemingia macrophylla]|uniref:Uncharacterized protein n=1 Tax=Flemingia macrophylla TaxID=520843 RepID=A0ABD1N070_9FABA